MERFITERAGRADFEEIRRESDLIFTCKTAEDGTVSFDEGFFCRLLPKLYGDGADTGRCHFITRDTERDGKIVAIVGVFENTVTVFGERIPYAGIGTVGVDPEYRGWGLMKSLLCEALSYIEKSGAVFSYLGGLRQRYEHFGFAPGGASARFVLTNRNADCVFGKGKTFGYDISLLSGDDTDSLSKIAHFHGSLDISFERDRGHLYDVLTSWENVPRVIAKDGNFCGWCLTDGACNAVHELVLLPHVPVSEVLCDIVRLSGAGHTVFYNVSFFDTRQYSCLSRISEDIIIGNCGMYRIFDYPRFLSLLLSAKERSEGLVDGKVSFLITDSDCAFTVTVKDGHSEVTPGAERDAVRLDGLEAVRLFLGAGHSGVSVPSVLGQWFPISFRICGADGV